MVGDHRLGADVHAVDHAAVGNSRTGTDVDRDARRGVQQTAVLRVGALAMIGAKSARITALNHTDAPAATWTSPTSVAVGATNAPGSTAGDRPSNAYSGIAWIYRR
jgi:hypothetical protein